MSLDELMPDEDDEQTSEDDEWFSDADSVVTTSRVKYQKDKLHKPEMCPECGTTDTAESHYERRCNNKSCDVITYIPTDFKVSPSVFK